MIFPRCSPFPKLFPFNRPAFPMDFPSFSTSAFHFPVPSDSLQVILSTISSSFSRCSATCPAAPGSSEAPCNSSSCDMGDGTEVTKENGDLYWFTWICDGSQWFIMIHNEFIWIYIDLHGFMIVHKDLCWLIMIIHGFIWIYDGSQWFILLHNDLYWFTIVFWLIHCIHTHIYIYIHIRFMIAKPIDRWNHGIWRYLYKVSNDVEWDTTITNWKITIFNG